MKAKIYRELICENGCSIFGLVDHSITLEEARSGRFEASEPFGDSSFLYSVVKNNLMNGDAINPLRYTRNSRINVSIKFKDGRLFDGFIVFKAIKALAEFVAKNIDLNSDCGMALYIKGFVPFYLKSSVSVLKGALAEALTNQLNSSPILHEREIGEEAGRYKRGGVFKPLSINGVRHLLVNPELQAGQSLVICSGFRKDFPEVPGVDWLYTEESRRNEYCVRGVTCMNQKIRQYGSINDINPFVFKYFESKGEFFKGSRFDLVPDESRVITHFLRVPSRSEFREFEKAKETSAPGIGACFVADSRAALYPAAPGCSVIKDYGVFKRVASRAVRGIYLPTGIPYDITEGAFPEKEEYLALSVAA